MGLLRLSKSNRYKVGNEQLFIPSYNGGLKVEHSNVVDENSGRDQKGVMHKTWLRRDVRKVSLQYNYLTGDDVAKLESLLQGKDFKFTYWDMNKEVTIDAYCGESSYEKVTDALYTSEGGLYQNFSANIIEN